MADLLNTLVLQPRRSAFPASCPGFPVAHASLTVKEAPVAGIVHVRWRAGDITFVRSLEALLSLPLPSAGRAIEGGNLQLAWAGPAECLLFCRIEDEDGWCAALDSAKSDQAVAASAISDGRIGLDIEGADAREFLAKGCSIDLHPRVFGKGHVAMTRFAGQPAMLMHREIDAFRLFVDTSIAAYIRRWIIDAAKEFGSAS